MDWFERSIFTGRSRHEYPEQAEQIENEWRLTTLYQLEAGDPTMCALLTDPEYAFATVLPDGNYPKIYACFYIALLF
ncbi:MAG: hypothetical protein RLP44_02025 [Aggregatilineales bacterium]